MFNITGGSNTLMDDLKGHVSSTFPTSAIKWESAAYPILDLTNPLTLSLCLIAIGYDVLSRIPNITLLCIWNEFLNQIREKECVSDDDHGKRFHFLMEYVLKNNKSKTMKESDVFTFCQMFLYQPALEYGKRSSKYIQIFIQHTNITFPLLANVSPPQC